MQYVENAVSLSAIEENGSAVILGFKEFDTPLSQRLLELGFVSGSVITFCGKAPFGGPFMYRIHGGKLALRKSDATSVLVIPLA